MKFDMGATTLGDLAKNTAGASDDLGVLIRQLVAAADPLEGRFNGAGRAAFDSFKARADAITNDLNSSLRAILGGQSGMNNSFVTGDQEQESNAQHTMSAANFDAARFGAR